MRRPWVLVLAVLVMAFGPVPAPASARSQDCGPGDICVWEHDHYEGCFAALNMVNHERDVRQHPNWKHVRWTNCHDGPDTGHINDQVSSIWNQSDQWVIFFGHSNYRGLGLCMEPGARSHNLKNFGNPETPEDRLSSHSAWPEGNPGHWSQEGRCANIDYADPEE